MADPFIEDGYEAAVATFRAVPSVYTAGIYLKMLMAAEGEDLLSDDDFLDGLAEVRDYLISDRSK